MNKRGPKRTPTKKLRLAGSPLADQRGDDLVVAVEQPERPGWVVGEAAAVFDGLVARLGKLGLLNGIDAEALALFSDAVAEYRQLTKAIAVEGFTTETAEGTLKTHPNVNARQLAWSRIKLGMAQFGLSPGDRASLKIEAPKASGENPGVPLGALG